LSFFERIQKYFQGISDKFEASISSSSVFPNKPDKGETRENILKSFFEKHLPRNTTANKGGFIFNLDGNESKQIDLFITNDSTLQFKEFGESNKNGKTFNFVGGCIAAITIKSVLDKNGILDSLENLASIPKFPNTNGKLPPNLRVNPELVENLPLKIVFGFNGISLEKTIEHINKFYIKNSYPRYKRADVIVLNNQFIIVKTGRKGSNLRDGTKIPSGIYHGMNGSLIGSYSLLYILLKIQRAAQISNFILLNVNSLLDKLPLN